MRSKIFMLAASAMLAASMPAQAILTLEFWAGMQDLTPGVGTVAAPVGLSHFGLTANTFDPNGDPVPYVGGKLSSLNLNVGQQYVLRIVLRDQGANLTAPNEAAAGYSFAQNQGPGGLKLNTWTVNFQYTPSLTGQRDAVAGDGQAQTAAIYAGTSFSTGAFDGSDNGTAIAESAPYAVANFGPNNFSMGTLYLNGITTGQQNVVGQPVNSSANSWRRYFTLANIVLTANSVGSGNLVLAKPTTNPPTWGGLDSAFNSVSMDADIWGVSGTNQFVLPFNVVPEPSSMILAGLAVSGLGYRLRRKFRGEKATA